MSLVPMIVSATGAGGGAASGDEAWAPGPGARPQAEPGPGFVAAEPMLDEEQRRRTLRMP